MQVKGKMNEIGSVKVRKSKDLETFLEIEYLQNLGIPHKLHHFPSKWIIQGNRNIQMAIMFRSLLLNFSKSNQSLHQTSHVVVIRVLCLDNISDLSKAFLLKYRKRIELFRWIEMLNISIHLNCSILFTKVPQKDRTIQMNRNVYPVIQTVWKWFATVYTVWLTVPLFQ